jgi:predicted ATP-grasp superfamily ATP-dependent carboligase
VGRQKALKVGSFEDLERFYRRFSDRDPVVSVQEWIEGGEEDLLIFGSVCSDRHEVLASFTARKRLQYPPLAGTGIVVEALPLPQLEKPSHDLLAAVKFRGISEIEYKRDRRTGKLYLIEINPRHWDQHGLGTQVGVNLSEALYRDATLQAPRAMQQGAERCLWIAEAEYARHLLRCLAGRAPLRDATLAFGARRTWTVFDRRDMRPFLSLLGIGKPA